MSDERAKIDFLRHAVATLAYRGGKAIRDAPEEFGELTIGSGTRTPFQILAHIGAVLDWAVALAKGQEAGRGANPGSWQSASERFFAGLAALDDVLSSGQIACPPERLLQGPVADALTHVGQIAMLRRIAGSPVQGENFFRAEIVVGRVGEDQSPPAREFD